MVFVFPFLTYLVWESLVPSMLLQITLFCSSCGWIVFHCVYVPHFWIHSSVNGCLGCFHVLAIVNSVAISTEKKIMDLENRLVVAKGKGEGVGWFGSLGLIGTDRCLWNGLAMRSCCVALGNMSSYLWWSMILCKNRMCTYMCNWVTMLYSRKNCIW